MGLQDCYCEHLILKTAVAVCSPQPEPLNIRHIVGRAVEPGSIKLNALPCVWFPTLGLRAASRLNGYYPDQPRGQGARHHNSFFRHRVRLGRVFGGALAVTE
jgi:hypothetical protein